MSVHTQFLTSSLTAIFLFFLPSVRANATNAFKLYNTDRLNWVANISEHFDNGFEQRSTTALATWLSLDTTLQSETTLWLTHSVIANGRDCQSWSRIWTIPYQRHYLNFKKWKRFLIKFLFFSIRQYFKHLVKKVMYQNYLHLIANIFVKISWRALARKKKFSPGGV